MMIWAFYDENQIYSNYNISRSDMRFYFIFMVMIIPFQLVIDIFFINIVRHYHTICFLDYIKELKENFKKRTTMWMTNQPYKNPHNIPHNQTSLDQWGFSA